MKDDSIRHFLKSFNILRDSEIDTFIRLLSNKILKKYEYFIQEGQTCNQVAFVLSGSLRSYYTSDKGEEITYCITFPKSFIIAYFYFLQAHQTKKNIKPLKKTK